MIKRIIRRLKRLFIRNMINWYKQVREYQYLRELIKQVERKNLIDKKIVINTTYVRKNIFDVIVFLGMLLSLNGAKVKILLDDGILMHNETFFRSQLPRSMKKFEKKNLNVYYYYNKNWNLLEAIIYRNLIKNAKKTYKVENLDFIYYSDILRNINIEIKNWQELRKHSISSTIRFFETSELDYNKKEVQYYYKLSLMNSILSRKLGFYILNELKPDLYLTPHGIYSTHGPAYEFLKQNNVESLVYIGRNKRVKNIFQVLFTDAVQQLLTRDTYWQKYKNKPVTDLMISDVESFFKDRINFAAFDNALYYSGDLKTFSVDKNDGYKYHVAIFPNVIWDGNIEERHNVFDGYVDWLIETINFLKNRKDIKLYVRPHPSEASIWKGAEKILDILKKYIDFNDAKNIVLIPSDANIDVYSFIKSGIDLGLVYDNTIAIELVYLKVPPLVCVNGGRFTIEGGCYLAKSKEEYFEYLNNIEKMIKNFHYNYEKFYLNVIRFVNWSMFEMGVALPYVSQNKFDFFNLNKKSLKLDEKLLKLIEIYGN